VLVFITGDAKVILTFLDAFAKQLQKATFRLSALSCLSVCRQETVRFPQKDFRKISYFRYLLKFAEIPILFKI
jgi:hypothetical protein